MPAPQTFKNHTRFYPPFHFVLMPLLLINLGFAITALVRHYPAHQHVFGWWIVMSVALMLLAFTARSTALAVQDRVIRLEERIRLAGLGVPASTIDSLTIRQFVGLRFASDGEAAMLAHRAVAEALTTKAIKDSITTWKPDYHRA
jgi:hypothetical protein